MAIDDYDGEVAYAENVDEVTPEEMAEVAKMLPATSNTIEAGTLALASMTEEAFDARLAMLKAGRVRVARIQRELLRPDVDYGVIPGTGKPALLKPGAEKLCDFYRFAADFAPSIEYGDSDYAPAVTVLTRCSLHLGTLDGPVIAVGYGQANSWEKRYRYRKGGRACPKCGVVGSMTTKPTSRGSHWCIPDKGGCNENISAEDYNAAKIEERQDNPDPYELANTLVKMAEKRAHVDATLRATATSGLFTQDEDDRVRPSTSSDAPSDAGRSRGMSNHADEAGASGIASDATVGASAMDSEEGLPDIPNAANVENCPKHGKPFQLRTNSKDDSTYWSCGTKDGGKWCDERPSAAFMARHEV